MSEQKQAAVPYQHAVDAAVLVVLLGIGVLGFGPSFGGDGHYLLAGVGAIVLGLGIGWLGARYRFGVLITAAATLIVYLLFGSALATPQEAFAGFLPTGASLASLLLGVVVSWKQILTIAAPVGIGGGLLVVPYLSALVTAVVAASLAWRRRRAGWVMIPVLVLFLASILFGTNVAASPMLRGLALTLVSVGWLAWRRAVARVDATAQLSANLAEQDVTEARTSRMRRLVASAAVIVVAGGVAAVAAPALTGGQSRQVLRDVVEPPVDLHDYPTPLMSFRHYVKDASDKTLFTVQGLPTGQRVRLAALDAYNGIVYDVDSGAAGNFAPVGDAQTLAAGGEDTDGDTETLKFTMDNYSGVWVPSSGSMLGMDIGGDRARRIGGSLYYNEGSNTILSTAGLSEGDSYRISVRYDDEFTDSQLSQYGFADLSMPRLKNVPDIIAAKASEFVGDASTPIERARNLEAALKNQGAFSNGKEGEVPSLSGHYAGRIASMLDAKQMVGDDEQYAVAMALMARHLGMPARVVMGFYVDEKTQKTATGPIAIKGKNVHAWVEIAFDKAGWVPFFPTPDEDHVPIPPEPEPRSKPKPQVLQPPPPPQEPAELPPDSAPDPLDAEKQEQGFWAIWGPILAAVGLAAIPVAIIVLPLLFIAWLKLRRRKRRADQGMPAQRVHGGWSEVLSLATDMGAAVNVKATRRESATMLGEAFPGSDTATRTLAHHADAVIFSPGDPSEDEVRQYWVRVHGSLDDMRGSVGFWKRQRAKYSPRSLLADARAAVTARRKGRDESGQ